MVRMLVGQPPARCRFGLKFGVNLLTRCTNKPGHGGRHTGPGLRKFSYQKVNWFAGDSREFVTDRDEEFAWSERKEKKI